MPARPLVRVIRRRPTARTGVTTNPFEDPLLEVAEVFRIDVVAQLYNDLLPAMPVLGDWEVDQPFELIPRPEYLPVRLQRRRFPHQADAYVGMLQMAIVGGDAYVADVIAHQLAWDEAFLEFWEDFVPVQYLIDRPGVFVRTRAAAFRQLDEGTREVLREIVEDLRQRNTGAAMAAFYVIDNIAEVMRLQAWSLNPVGFMPVRAN